MICFGYSKLTFNISMAFIRHDCRLWICARANFAHAFLCRCFDNAVLLKQPAYRNRILFQADIVTYRRIRKFIRGRAMKTDPRYLLVNLYQTIAKVWWRKMMVWHILSCEVYSCILFERAARVSRTFSNMADILSEVMYLYSKWGLTCYWGIYCNEWCIVNYLMYIQTD